MYLEESVVRAAQGSKCSDIHAFEFRLHHGSARSGARLSSEQVRVTGKDA